MRNFFNVLTGMFLIVSYCFFQVCAENINLTGVIKNAITQQAVAGATVRLSVYPNISTTTDNSGAYTLSGTVPITTTLSPQHLSQAPYFYRNNFCFSVANDNELVKIDLYNLSGRCVASVINQKFYKGNYRVNPFNDRLTGQLYVVRFIAGTYTVAVKMPHVKMTPAFSMALLHNVDAEPSVREQASIKTVCDTLVISATNYKFRTQAISAYTGQNDITLTRSDILQGKLSITSVSPKGITSGRIAGMIDTSVFVEPTVRPGFINSGAPDSLTVTLKGIIVTTSQVNKYVWRGHKSLVLKGNGVLNLSDLFIDSIPKERITQVALIFDNRAQICGTLTGKFNVDTSNQLENFQTKTFYTKSNLSYNAASHTGGADSTLGRYAAFQGAPAELAAIRLSGGEDADTNMSPINTAADFLYDSTKTPALTILFDLSRMLRFYDGCNLTAQGGVNPNDPASRAYFFCHSVFWCSVAAFFGDVGEIQGYQTLYSHISGTNNTGIPGWMTIICNPAGDILSGILIGDDDNALTVAKGMIDTVKAGTTYTFHYTISNVVITEFNKLTVLGDSVFVRWNQRPPADPRRNPPLFGKARFNLRFKTQ